MAIISAEKVELPATAPPSVDASSLLVPGVMLDARSMVPPGDWGSNITYTHTHTRGHTQTYTDNDMMTLLVWLVVTLHHYLTDINIH